jgi:type II secretory pathway component PulM
MATPPASTLVSTAEVCPFSVSEQEWPGVRTRFRIAVAGVVIALVLVATSLLLWRSGGGTWRLIQPVGYGVVAALSAIQARRHHRDMNSKCADAG